MPVPPEFMGYNLASAQRPKIDACVLVNRQRTVGAGMRSDQPELALPFSIGECLLLIARSDAFGLWQQPDLIEMHRFLGGWVEFAVPNSGAGAHALEFAGVEDGVVAH